MPIIHYVKPTCLHPGRPSPHDKRYGVGTIYECDECEKRFELSSDRDGRLWRDMACIKPPHYKPL